MKIEGTGNIAHIFSIFHDGVIVNCRLENDALRMDVEIRYLAQRVNPNFTMFSVTLHQVEEISFSTWPHDLQSAPELLTDINTIFKPELDILDGTTNDGRIQVVCNQPAGDFAYCGGELYLSASSAQVTDEAGKNYTINELSTICKAYWDEWTNKNKA